MALKCSKCGNEMKEGQKFCMKCGAPASATPKLRQIPNRWMLLLYVQNVAIR